MANFNEFQSIESIQSNINYNNVLYVSISLYLIITLLILFIRPKLIFCKNGDIRKTGCGHNKTVFSLPIILIFLSFISYFIIIIIYQIKSIYLS